MNTQTISDYSAYLVTGCDSYSEPTALAPTEYIAGMNIVNRGGLAQTRPGSITRLWAGVGRFQGACGFTPTGGAAHIAYALDGEVYVSKAPFKASRKLPNIQFNPNAEFITFESCLQSTDFTDDGALVALERPYSILIMQSGSNRAAYWDGGSSGHLNPTPSGTELTKPGFDETFIGLHMKWSGNRLWVSRGPLVFASDLGNPRKFTEAQYINEGRAFYLPADCTGMVETPDRKGLIAFTQKRGELFQSNIQDRTKWLSTDDFQATVFQNIGCVAPRSIITQYGLIWWFSSVGLINSDQALALNRSSKIDLQDNEMMCSKGNLGPNLSRVACGAHENYLLVSVPSGSRWNRHTWCMDQAVFEGGANAWNSYWTGWNPIQWVSLTVDGHERIFFASRSDDGCNQIWEAFQSDRQDNGQPITSFIQFRQHDFSQGGAAPRANKNFHFARLRIKELLGECSLSIAVQGERGGWTRLMTTELVATRGGIRSDELYDLTTCMNGHRPQTRVITTPADVPPSACNGCDVESDLPANIDTSFSIMAAWSGRMGIAALDLVASLSDQRIAGECVADEEAPKSLNENGCGQTALHAYGCTFESFTSTKTVYVRCEETDGDIAATATVVSALSQVDADRRADGLARLKAEQTCRCASNVAPEVDAGTYDPVVNTGDPAGVDVQLDGTVSDDTFPSNILVQEWTVISGPGDVIFTDDTAVDTVANFTEPGTYVLRLTASDGALSTSDDATIVILEPTCESTNFGDDDFESYSIGSPPTMNVGSGNWAEICDNPTVISQDIFDPYFGIDDIEGYETGGNFTLPLNLGTSFLNT